MTAIVRCLFCKGHKMIQCLTSLFDSGFRIFVVVKRNCHSGVVRNVFCASLVFAYCLTKSVPAEATDIAGENIAFFSDFVERTVEDVNFPKPPVITIDDFAENGKQVLSIPRLELNGLDFFCVPKSEIRNEADRSNCSEYCIDGSCVYISHKISGIILGVVLGLIVINIVWPNTGRT